MKRVGRKRESRVVTSKLLHRDLSGQFLLGQLIVHRQLVSEGGEETKVKGVSRPSQRAGAVRSDWLKSRAGASAIRRLGLLPR